MRLMIPLSLAIPATLGLFLVMSEMIKPSDLEPPEAAAPRIGVEIVRPPPVVDRQRPPPPEPRGEPPQSIAEAAQEVMDPWEPPRVFALDPMEYGLRPSRGSYGDRAAFPLIQPTGLYPIAARREEVEGWVRVRFTVLPDGSTHDIEIIEASPEGYFEAHAIRSISRWRFRPAFRDGQAVSESVEHIVDYNLESIR
jgi:protein TonB